jgi:lactate dehydrogenase-like 2-hydroxyacid dehydrogenase
VVVEAGLVYAVNQTAIAGGGVEFFDGEPALDRGYLELPNVVLTPHIGSASAATRMTMCRLAADNLTAVLEGRTPPNLVNA